MFTGTSECFVDSMPFDEFVKIGNDGDYLLSHSTDFLDLLDVAVVEGPNLLLK